MAITKSSSLKGKSDSEIENFLNKLRAYLIAHKKEKMLKEVLKILKQNKNHAGGRASVVTAKKETEETKNTIISKHKDVLQNREIIFETDETLINGYRIDTEDLRIDYSYKQKLLALYQTILKTTN
jgi:F0F1-type ATP synthase delta subunit